MGEAAKSFSSASAALPLPRRVGRRVLLKLAARGGMGDVYLAATTGIEGAERPCIVKTVRRDHAHDSSFLARFLDEARVQAQLNHPGVAQVLEASTDDDGEPYTVVEFVEGRSLGDVRQRTIQTGVTMSWVDALAVAIEIAQALAHVHERAGADGAPLGIVHRDLSPQNVMIGYAGEVKLIDFGTARAHNRRSQTVAGVVFAKPGYVAPEVARQQVGDGRIDLYALGVILWELCAGRRLLTTDPQRHLDDVAAGKVAIPAIAEACGAPSGLDEVIARLTSNEPDDRFPRASLAVPELARVLTSAPVVEGSERGVRARVAALMRRLWPHEPARARAEFSRLLRDARELLRGELRSERPIASKPGKTSDLTCPPSSACGLEQERAVAAADASHLAGTPYRLLRTIGEGTGGVVWEAEHVELRRRVALKVLAAEHASSGALLERFRQEARTLSALSHPNLVATLDFGKSLDGRVFLAMELLVGETLEARLRAGPLDCRETIDIAVQACDALAAAHAAGLVHRDIKPANLMLTCGGRVKLLDFGVAVALSGRAAAQSTHPRSQRDQGDSAARMRALQGFAVFGTPEYMAPEQVAGDPIDARTDIYALGCVLFEMLSGAPPFEGSSGLVVMGKQLRDAPRSPRQIAPERRITAALEAVVTRAMDKRPSRRFASAAAMREALEETMCGAERRRARARGLASGVLLAMAMLASAAASAQWTRTRLSGLPFASWLPASDEPPRLPHVEVEKPPPLAPAATMTTVVSTPPLAAAGPRQAETPPRRDAHTVPSTIVPSTIATTLFKRTRELAAGETASDSTAPRPALLARSKR